MNKPFTIFTESGYRYDRLKRYVLRLGGKILGRKVYGPISVYQSLIRGLEELKKEGVDIIYNVNPRLVTDVYETAVVLMGKDTLQYAIDLKKQGIIKKLIAGPAISVPIDNKDMCFHDYIDIIVVPSQRVKDYFISLQIQSSQRIGVWPAGVEDISVSNKSKQQILIYKKSCPELLHIKIIEYLNRQGIEYKTLYYGKFQFSEYQQLLDESVAMIYLQESESQGIALQEAWIKDIPTLVWDRGYRTYKHIKRESKQISCPLMTDECGLTFTEMNFQEKFSIFMDNLSEYNPREYCINNLSDGMSAKILLSYISL